MNWYIGQEIVCIKSHSQGIVEEGKVYTIQGLRQSCCSVCIDIGCKTNRGYTKCGKCNTIYYPPDEIYWILERLFAPIEYNQQAISELLENISTLSL